MIWLTTPMQGSPKKRSILANADWLRATAEELSKSMIWLTTPMQGSPKKRSIYANADWMGATAITFDSLSQ
jgi:hypothetical protein